MDGKQQTESAQSEGERTHLLIRASAGTGKTYQLSSRFLRLLLAGVEIDQILATTFTRKAAGEILTRIVRWLAEAVTSDQARSELASAVGRTELTSELCLQHLRTLVRQLHRIRVATLDSFFINLASGFEFELGLPPNWSVCDPIDEASIRAKALNRMLAARAQDAMEWVYLLHKGQAKRGVHSKLFQTVEEAHTIFCETSPAAWTKLKAPNGLTDEELRGALQRLRDVELPENQTVRKAHASAIERVECEDWDGLIAAGIAKAIAEGKDAYSRWTIPDEVSDAYRPLIQHASAIALFSVVQQTEAAYELLQRYDECFRQLQNEQATLRFMDIPPALVELIQSDSSDRFAYRMGARIDHLLLDEFQDTALSQWRCLAPISQRIAVGLPPENSFFCVGDTKQAIYGWRGGMVEIFDYIERNLPNLRRESLVSSFRSSEAVISTVNRVFGQMQQHNDLGDLAEAIAKWCRAFEPHSTHRTELPGYACLITTKEVDKEDDENEKELIEAKTISLVEDLYNAAPGRSIAILTRSNQPISRLIYRLRQRGIPASEEGGNPLTDSAAVQVILSLLIIADHPNDTVAQFHVAHSPLGEFLEWTPANVGNRVQAASLALRIRRALLREGYGSCVSQWGDALRAACTRREWDRIQQLIETAFRYERRSTLRPIDFVHLVQEQTVLDPSSAPIRVMTVHQSKGLEFDAVVFCELEGQLSPRPGGFVVAHDPQTLEATHVVRYANKHIQALMPQRIQKVFDQALSRDIGESLCVLYVALTRAKHALYLITTPRMPSASASTKKVPTVKHRKRYSGLLHAALVGNEPLIPEQVVYECGDAKWYQQLVGNKPAPAIPPERPRIKPIRFAPPQRGRTQTLDTVAPSSLEGGGKLKLEELPDAQREFAFAYGTVMHAWFEQIEWLETRSLSDLQLVEIAKRYHDYPAERVPEAIERFRWMLQQQETQQLFTRAAYIQSAALQYPDAIAHQLQSSHVQWDVHREARIASPDKDWLIVGNVDRLVVASTDQRLVAAEVIDFKTDKIETPEQLEQRVAYYRPQLWAYGRAVAKMLRLPDDAIAMRLLFVETGESVPLGALAKASR